MKKNWIKPMMNILKVEGGNSASPIEDADYSPYSS